MALLEGLEFLTNVKPTSMKKKKKQLVMLYVLPFESTSLNSYSNLQPQTKIVGTLPPNAVLSLLAGLLVLPMLIIAVNSPNLAHQHTNIGRRGGGGEGVVRGKEDSKVSQ